MRFIKIIAIIIFIAGIGVFGGSKGKWSIINTL